jgi:hypothetical protein
MAKSILGFLKGENLVCFNTDGSVDWDVTSENIRCVVDQEVFNCAEADSKIETALNEVFNQLPDGAHIPSPLAVNLVVSKIAIPGDITSMTEATNQVNAYLERSTKFVGKRGRNGGLTRVG